jgi:hypothetical protein
MNNEQCCKSLFVFCHDGTTHISLEEEILESKNMCSYPVIYQDDYRGENKKVKVKWRDIKEKGQLIDTK